VNIADLPFRQRNRQRIGIELRIGARSRDRPDIDDQVNPGFVQQVDELGDASSRMADGEEDGRFVLREAWQGGVGSAAPD
jgi:hypothetical protein